MGEISFDVDALIGHARTVDQLAGDVAGAGGRLGVGVGGRAFGSLGSFVVGALQGVGEAASSAYNGALGALGGTASQLREVASEVQELEEEIAASLRAAESELGYRGAW